MDDRSDDALQVDIETVLHALSEPMRFRIVQLLLERHHCARSLALSLGVSGSAISQHMAVLRECELVTCWRHGRHVHYQVDIAVLEEVISRMSGWVERAEEIGDCHRDNPCRFRMCCCTSDTDTRERKTDETGGTE